MAGAAMAALGLVPGAAAATASAAVTSASAPQHAALADVVLVNQPASRVCVGNKFTVGVWYQQFSGGSRAYRVLVYNPSWKLIFYRKGYASPTAWKLWHIRAQRLGNYHTTYKLKNSSGHWVKYRATTRSHRC